MAEKTKPEFKGKPLIEIPQDNPLVGFLEGDFGEAVHEEIARKYSAFPVVTSDVQYANGILRGSKPFYVVAVQNSDLVREEKLRTATQADLERILKADTLNLNGVYIDSGLVWRNNDEPNSYLAGDLSAQMQKRLGKLENTPYVVWLKDLELTEDQDSPHGLAFKLKDNAQIIPAQILAESGYFSSENIDEKTGLPTKLAKEGRYSYTAKNSLRRLCSGGGSDLYSGDGYLADSGEFGRVVLVSDEVGAPKNLVRTYLGELEKQRDRQIEAINERYEKAKRIMDGS